MASLGMASRPVYFSAMTACVERVLGFPDIIGNLSPYSIFFNGTDWCVALDASWKKSYILLSNAQNQKDFPKLFKWMVGSYEDTLFSDIHVTDSFCSGEQDTVSCGIDQFFSGYLCPINGIKAKYSKPFRQLSQRDLRNKPYLIFTIHCFINWIFCVFNYPKNKMITCCIALSSSRVSMIGFWYKLYWIHPTIYSLFTIHYLLFTTYGLLRFHTLECR